MTGPVTLPAPFEPLQPYVARWALAAEVERNARRRASSMAEISAFYDATAALLPAIADRLGSREAHELDPAEHALLLLTLSLMEVAPAVELYFQPDVVDAAPAEQLVICQ